MAEKTISTSIRLPAELHWRFKEAALKLRINETEAIRQAITEFIERGNLAESTSASREEHGRKSSNDPSEIRRLLERIMQLIERTGVEDKRDAG